MHSSVSPRDALSQLVQPQAFDTREHWLDAVARKAGISYRAAKGIFYGEITDPEHRAFRRVTDKIIERAKSAGAEHETIASDFDELCSRARLLIAENERVRSELEAVLSEIHQRRDGDAGIPHT